MNNSFKKIIATIIASAIIISTNIVNAQSDKDLLFKQIKGVPREEIETAILDISESTGKSEAEVIKQLLNELKEAKGEDKISNEFMLRSGGNSEWYTYLDEPRYKGDILNYKYSKIYREY